MNFPKFILFDFDGTIADTLNEIFEIYNLLAPEFGLTQLKKEDISKIRSQGYKNFLKNFPLSKIKTSLLLLRGRKELNKRIGKIKPFKGIKPVLRKLKNQGFILGILSSNSLENIEFFLTKNNLRELFDFIHSQINLFGKERAILNFLNKHQIAKKDIVYVGDEIRDIEAAKKVGIPVIAVSWGFNEKETLLSLKPRAIAENPQQLLECVFKIFKNNATS